MMLLSYRLEAVVDVKQLMFFKRTAELEHMTRAAEDLQTSQPFLSRTLADLEAELGAKLFDRVGRNIVLNATGKAFYTRVVTVFHEMEDAIAEVRDLNNASLRKLTVVTNVGLYMPDLLKTLLGSNPTLAVTQYSARRSRIEQMLLAGDVDFAIHCPPLDGNPEIECVPLRSEPFVVVYPPGHRLEHQQEVRLRDIEDEAFVSVPVGFGARDEVERYTREADVHVRFVIETADTTSVLRYVSRGLGIAFVAYSQVLAEPWFRDHYVKVTPTMYGHVALAWRRRRYLNQTATLFIDATRDHFWSLVDLPE